MSYLTDYIDSGSHLTLATYVGTSIGISNWCRLQGPLILGPSDTFDVQTNSCTHLWWRRARARLRVRGTWGPWTSDPCRPFIKPWTSDQPGSLHSQSLEITELGALLGRPEARLSAGRSPLLRPRPHSSRPLYTRSLNRGSILQQLLGVDRWDTAQYCRGALRGLHHPMISPNQKLLDPKIWNLAENLAAL